MTQQATAPAPPPQQPAGRPTPSVAAATAQDEHTAWLKVDTPRLLNRLQVLAVTACLVFGVVAALLQVLAWQANGRAADNTEQVVRVQEIKTQLLRADALATNSFLVGGLEPPEARAEYDAAIDRVLTLITDAAEAQSADREALSQLSTRVNDYVTAVAQARDYNRQGEPIAIAYLNIASDLLRVSDVEDRTNTAAIAICDSLVRANTGRATDEMGAHHPLLLFLVGVVAIAALWFVNRTIAKRFRRRFNVGVAAAAVILAVLTLVTALYASSRNGANDDTREGAYTTAVDEASARAAANNAKANESQGLINRGSGEIFDQGETEDDRNSFVSQQAIVERSASPRTLRLWETYLVAHTEVRQLDRGGDWEGARDLAISTEPDDPTALLDEVDASAADVTETAAAEATDSFRSGSIASIALIVLTLLGSVVAAGAIAWGVNQRRREFS